MRDGESEIPFKDPLRAKRRDYAAMHMRSQLPENFCSAPFTQMFLYPTGDVFVCCEGAGHLGNLRENSLEEMWNGETAQRLRREFLEGKPKECANKIACKGCNRDYDDQLPMADFRVVQPDPPKALDVILNGRCNIDCVMCEVKNARQSVVELPRYRTEIVEKVFPKLRQIEVKSGEPFIQRETYDALKALRAVNPGCTWRFTTNGQFQFNKTVQKALGEVLVDRITFSVDSVKPENFAAIRKGGTLEKLEETVAAMQEWARRKDQPFEIEFGVGITLQRANWADVPETFLHYARRGFRPHIIPVEEPAEFSLRGLPDDEKLEILAHYARLPAEHDPHMRVYVQSLQGLLGSIGHPRARSLRAFMEMRVNDAQEARRQVCTLPFTQLSIFADGSLKPCCWLHDYDLVEGGGRRPDFREVWTGAPATQLRREFQEGKPKICRDKIRRFGCNTKNGKLHQLFATDTFRPKAIPRLHWFFNGKCNIQCQTCNNWKITEEFPESEQYWEALVRDVFPYLCEIELVGGEPFYQKRTYQLFQTLSEVNPLCVWEITSNGQFEFPGRIEEHLEKIRISHFSVSIDSLDPAKFNKIRTGGVLSRTLQFLEDLRRFSASRPMGRGFPINVNFVLQRENWDELEDMVRFTRERGLGLYVIPMFEPGQYSIYTLPTEERAVIGASLAPLAEKYGLPDVRDVVEALGTERALANWPQ